MIYAQKVLNESRHLHIYRVYKYIEYNITYLEQNIYSHCHTELIIIRLALIKAICRSRINSALVELKALAKNDLRKH